jgi:hypothetical protein
MNTTPATEENLTLNVEAINADIDDDVKKHMIPVIVDGIKGKAGIHTFGAWSLRIGMILSEPHDELGTEFQTKYFRFLEPGKVEWGNDGSTFKIDLVGPQDQ